MPITLNGTDITSNKINNSNITEEKLNGTRVYPSIPVYVVIFYDYQGDGGNELKMENVQQGGDATAPPDPTRAGYTFTGWDKSFTNVQSNLVVHGTWQQTSFNYYVLIDVGDYNLASGLYGATCPNDITSPIGHTASQTIIEDVLNGDATFVSTSTALHSAYAYTNPNLYNPTQYVAFCIEDLYQHLGSGTTPYIIYEVAT